MAASVVGIVLAGGRGTRLRGLYDDVPKPLIPCAGKPFIEWVIAHLHRQGVNDVLVSLGHLAPVARAHFDSREPDGVAIRSVVETQALGTGGAIAFAWDTLAPSPTILACNGDSLVLTDLRPSIAAVVEGRADGALVGVQCEDCTRFGSMDVGPDGMLRGFHEKRPGRGLINAGVYVLSARLRSDFADARPLSIETDVFPRMLANGRRLLVHPTDAPFLDIGLPETVAQADGFLQRFFDQRACAGSGS